MMLKYNCLKGSLTLDFQLQFFFLKSVSLMPLSNLLESFQICTEIGVDVHNYMVITGVNDSGDKVETFRVRKFFKIMSRFCWVAVYTHTKIFFLNISFEV